MKQMNVLTALLLACVLVTALPAAAQTVEPGMQSILKDVVAGKSFSARLVGYGHDDEGHFSFAWTLCEPERYPAEQIEALKKGDILVAGGTYYTVASITADEEGYIVHDDSFGDLILYREEDGSYTAVDDTEHVSWTGTVTVDVSATAQTIFRDASNPDLDVEPVDGTPEDLIRRIDSEEIWLSEDNTVITFDENGELTLILYVYTPWN